MDIAIEAILRSNKLRVVTEASDETNLALPGTRAMMNLLPFEEKSNPKHDNRLIFAKGDLTKYRMSVATVLPSFLNFIASVLGRFTVSPKSMIYTWSCTKACCV